MIKDAQGKEVKIGDKVAYVKHGYMQMQFGVVESFTPKSVKLVSGITRLPEQFVVLGV